MFGSIRVMLEQWVRRLFGIMRITESAGGVVVGPEGKVLVVNQDRRSWSLPKGHIDKGEAAQQAAVREIAEETGITELSFKKKLGTYRRFRIGKEGGEDTTEEKIITMFLFTTSQKEFAPRDPRHPEVRWVDRKKVADLLTHPKDKEFFETVMNEI